jgi:hypothetical protein
MVPMRNTVILLGLALAVRVFAAEPRVLASWDFSDEASREWSKQANWSKDVRLEDGVLKGTMTGSDPFVTSPAFSVKAAAGQVIELRAKVSTGGKGEIFWIPAGASQAQQKWSAAIDWIGDNQWHDYRVAPYWQGEKSIARLRVDFVPPRASEGTYEIDHIRIVDETAAAGSDARAWSGAALGAWRGADGAAAEAKGDVLALAAGKGEIGQLLSPNLKIPSDETCVVSVEMAVTEGDSGSLAWASDTVSGLHRRTFKLKADGRFHTYNVDVGGQKNWTGNIVLLKLAPAMRKGAKAQIRSISVAEEPQGAADVTVEQARLTDAINRAGRTAPLLIQFSNAGGKDAKNVTLAVKRLPKGVSVRSAPGWERVPEIPALGSVTHTLELAAVKAVSGDVEFALAGDGLEGQVVRAAIEILPDLKLEKAAYVPVPKPVKSDYEIGALYFPGWSKVEAWARIWPVSPERKPVLGWYDEAKPEVVDWQIKWAAENGLSYFLVDWYWHKGSQHHDHWIKAFQQARYKSYLKWAVMWANHNAAGSHSEADQREVAKFWIENYFNTPEYYRIDGKPVVMIWSPQNMNRDLGGGDGCKRLLDLSRKMAVEAGYKGIYFIAMKWPEASWDAKVVQGLKDMGFDMTSIYHFMDHGGKAENPRRFSFDLVADSNYDHWKGLQETGILPFLPNLSTGWDDRPWHGDKGIEIYGRTVRHFQRICKDAKKFADESGVKRLTLAPLNEWGEGSYAEPNAQFGFGMYEAVRDTFCRKPKEGWPLNYGPQDVGLGPYDLPPPVKDNATAWQFAKGTQGWYGLMGVEEFKASEGGLTFRTVTPDPAIERPLEAVRAKQFSRIAVRMKVADAQAGDGCQLFWQMGSAPASEATVIRLPVTPDNQFHDYVFEVGQHRQWRGRIGKLRFDPINQRGATVTIESIRMVPAAE